MDIDLMKKGKRKKKSSKKYRRTIKRYSLRINPGKWKVLVSLAKAYAGEKDIFLLMSSGLSRMEDCKQFREIRKGLVHNQYQSKFGLQARLWKLALKDALETLNRYWSALISDWRDRMYSVSITQEQRNYLYKAFNNYTNLLDVIFYRDVSLGLKLKPLEIKTCRRHLQKWIAKTVKKNPRVKICRSFLGEPETYRIFMHNGRQYIAIMTFIPHQRLCIPLTGRGKIRGQVRIVLDFDKQRIEVHHSVLSKCKKSKGEKKGIDLGITEVFTDSDGDRWGTNFGEVLTQYSDKQKNKGKKRNKLYSLSKKHAKNLNHRKKRKINKHNLGHKKQKKKHHNQKLHLTEIVNYALNGFFKRKDPCKIIYENLSRMKGKSRGKRFSRLISFWIISIIKERLDFKVSQRCSLLKRVNPAYSSQICFHCGWVHSNNRHGDKFKCLFCGHGAESDWMAALEILRRENDPDIFLWTPKNQVKTLLMQRFRRRLERWEFSFSASQVNWKSVRQSFGDDFIDGILQNQT